MATLSKPAEGSTGWATAVNQNWTDLETEMNGASTFQARLQCDSSTQISLQRYKGQIVSVNGRVVDPGSGGLSLTNTTNLITSTGADAGASMSASTLYYIYVSNVNASPYSSSLRASTTSPSSYNGIKYLGTSGNAANWRFVGWIRTNSATQFVNSIKQRFVINYYNRFGLTLEVTPAYSNDNSPSYFETTSGTYTPANSGTDSKLEFISNGEDPIAYSVFANIESRTSGQAAYLGIGEDSTSSAAVCTRSTLLDISLVSVGRSVNMGEGYHYLELLVAVSGGTGRYYSDLYRLGSGSDPRALVFSAMIYG